MSKKIYLKTAAILTAALLLVSELSAQDINDFLPFKPEAQREFVIIDTPHQYNLNPHEANYSQEAQFLTALYEGLFAYNPYTLEPEPAIAKTYKISRDKKTWTITLKEGVCFSDGTPITAETFKEAWLALLSPEAQAPFASLLDCIKGAADYRTGKAPAESVEIHANGNNLVLKLNAPTEQLSKILCHHAFCAFNGDKNAFSGPFIIDEKETTEDSYHFIKNVKYYDADKVALPSIRIYLSGDIENNTFRYNTGEVDWVSSGLNAAHLYDSSSIVVSTEFGTEYLFFTADKAPFDNADFRNALLLAVPWNELRQDAYIPAETLILPLSTYPSVNGFSDTDIEAAKALMEGIDLKDGCTITFAIPDNSYYKKQAEILKNSWEKLGIKLETLVTEDYDYGENLRRLNADLYCYTWIGDFADPTAFLELFRGGSSLKETAWENAEFDALMEEASRLTNPEKRYEKLAEAENLLLDEAVILPISHPIALNFIDLSSVGGWYSNALDIHPFKYIYFNQKQTELPGFVMNIQRQSFTENCKAF